MEGYMRGLMAVYHARLLRSLSCVLGAAYEEKGASPRRVHERERERDDRIESVGEREREVERRIGEKEGGVRSDVLTRV